MIDRVRLGNYAYVAKCRNTKHTKILTEIFPGILPQRTKRPICTFKKMADLLTPLTSAAKLSSKFRKYAEQEPCPPQCSQWNTLNMGLWGVWGDVGGGGIQPLTLYEPYGQNGLIQRGL